MSRLWWNVETVAMAVLAFIAGAGIGLGTLLLLTYLAGELR